jgi:hypothetical protein
MRLLLIDASAAVPRLNESNADFTRVSSPTPHSLSHPAHVVDFVGPQASHVHDIADENDDGKVSFKEMQV